MNRNLREVRRYWPLARVQWSYTTATCFVVPGAGGVWITVYPYGATVTVDTVQSGRMRYSGWTIPEAMRAAGVGVRPLGGFARELVKRAEYRQQIMGYAALGPSWAAGAARLLAYYQPRLADRQRPRKGARFGRRKRIDYGIGEKCYGLFPGGDPRLFTPDPQWCTPEEIARHAASCEDWNRGKRHDRGPSCLTMGDGPAWRGDGFGLGEYWWSWKDKRRGGAK